MSESTLSMSMFSSSADYWKAMYERREQEAHELSEVIIRLSTSLAEGKAEPAQDARRLFDAIVWALGAGDEFPPRVDGKPMYWWRSELQIRAGLVWDGEKFVASMSPPLAGEQP